jgi:hypothetical protein
MAAALSMPKQPFRITSPLIHDDPDEFNSIVGDTMLAQVSVLPSLFVHIRYMYTMYCSLDTSQPQCVLYL